jgi:hypothetical protein
MPRASSHRTLILCLGVSLAVASRFSTSTGGVEIAENQDAQLYVLLRNGEVIRGSVHRDADHLIIKRSGSVELRIPRKQISFMGANLNSVYEHRANQIIEFRADEHLELASWCLQNRLIGPTTRHILRAETIQPDHPQLSLLKARLERFLITTQKPAEGVSAVSVAAHEQRQTAPPPQAAGDPERIPAAREFVAQGPINGAACDPNHDAAPDATFAVESETASSPLATVESQTVEPQTVEPQTVEPQTVEPQSIEPQSIEPQSIEPQIADTPIETGESRGDDVSDDEIDLPPELMKAYASRIQPLLLNRCGAGHCHGHATTSSYQLHRIPNLRHPPRQITMRNLSATLQQLDRLHPENSPLLTWGQKAHGRMRSRLLAVSNAKQQQLLADWLKDVAAGRVTATQEHVAAQNETAPRLTSDRLPQARRASIQWQNQSRGETATGDAATKVSRTTKEDPFDPRSFNVEFGPKPPK